MNSSLSSARKFARLVPLLALVLAGCGPKDGAKEFAAGKAAFELKDFKKAEKLLSTCASLAPTNVDALVCLTRLKLEQGELKAAGEWIARAVALVPDDSDVRLLDAQLAWHAKDYARAAKAFAALGEDTSLPPNVRADGFTGLGIVEMACNAHHLARLAFLRAIRLDRRSASARYHLGLLYRDAPFGYFEMALEQFEIFVRLDAEASPRVQKVQRAIIPGLKDSIARAMTERPGAANRNSAQSAAAIAAAEAAWKKGNFKAARASYQEALQADALSYPAALGLAKAIAKTDASKDGQTKTLECYRMAAVLRPSAVSTLLAGGDLAAALGYHLQAQEFYSRALAANPTSVAALDGLVRAMRKVGGQQKIAQAYQDYRLFVAPVVKKAAVKKDVAPAKKAPAKPTVKKPTAKKKK